MLDYVMFLIRLIPWLGFLLPIAVLWGRARGIGIGAKTVLTLVYVVLVPLVYLFYRQFVAHSLHRHLVPEHGAYGTQLWWLYWIGFLGGSAFVLLFFATVRYASVHRRQGAISEKALVDWDVVVSGGAAFVLVVLVTVLTGAWLYRELRPVYYEYAGRTWSKPPADPDRIIIVVEANEPKKRDARSSLGERSLAKDLAKQLDDNLGKYKIDKEKIKIFYRPRSAGDRSLDRSTAAKHAADIGADLFLYSRPGEICLLTVARLDVALKYWGRFSRADRVGPPYLDLSGNGSGRDCKRFYYVPLVTSIVLTELGYPESANGILVALRGSMPDNSSQEYRCAVQSLLAENEWYLHQGSQRTELDLLDELKCPMTNVAKLIFDIRRATADLRDNQELPYDSIRTMYRVLRRDPGLITEGGGAGYFSRIRIVDALGGYLRALAELTRVNLAGPRDAAMSDRVSKYLDAGFVALSLGRCLIDYGVPGGTRHGGDVEGWSIESTRHWYASVKGTLYLHWATLVMNVEGPADKKPRPGKKAKDILDTLMVDLKFASPTGTEWLSSDVARDSSVRYLGEACARFKELYGRDNPDYQFLKLRAETLKLGAEKYVGALQNFVDHNQNYLPALYVLAVAVKDIDRSMAKSYANRFVSTFANLDTEVKAHWKTRLPPKFDKRIEDLSGKPLSLSGRSTDQQTHR